MLQILKDKILNFKNTIDNYESKQQILYLSTGAFALGFGILFIVQHKRKKSQTKPYLKFRQNLQQKINTQQQNNPSIVSFVLGKSQTLTHEHIVYKYNIIENLDKKPKPKTSSQERNPFLPPYEKGLYISEIGKDHRLLFNKFQVIEGHTLVVSKKFEKQHSILNATDFLASLEVCRVQKGFIYFNSGSDAGSSQPHKHLQSMPQKSWKYSDLLSEIKNYSLNHLSSKNPYGEFNLFKFKHVVISLKGLKEKELGIQEGRYIEYLYKEGLKKLDNLDLKYHYNLIFDDMFMFIVLRSKEKAFGKIALNAMGYTGSFILKNESQYQFALEKTPIELMTSVSVKLNDQNKSK